MNEDMFFFPAGIASDETFCNRTHERSFLKDSIKKNQHTVLASPRRYGKTSLILQVLTENQFPNCVIDFLPVTDMEFVKSAILAGVGTLLSDLLPIHKKLTQKLLGFFVNLNPKIVLSAAGQQVELSPNRTPQKSIMEALLGLDDLAKDINTRVVMVMDEFQQIGEINERQEIEASVRHAAERSKQVTYIFSGSNRHLLSQMFNDKQRPLYHLCEMMKLERISSIEYEKFIQNAAQKNWKKKLPEEVIQEILDLTQCHTYYVNALCRRVWKLEQIPTVLQINEIWNLSVTEQYPWIADDVSNLTVNQRSVLAALAYEPTDEPQGQSFNIKVRLTPSNIKRALDVLIIKDFVYQDNKGFYKVLDPAVLTYLRNIPFFNFEK